MAKKPAKAKAGPGRPSLYSVELVDRICNRIGAGESLRTICNDLDMPNRITVIRWLSVHEDFATKYAHAREVQADHEFDEIKAIADETPETEEVKDREGNVIEIRLSSAYVAWQKNRIEARKWRAERLKPKAYGTKVMSEVTGKDGGPIETREIPPVEAAQRAAFLIAKQAKART